MYSQEARTPTTVVPLSRRRLILGMGGGALASTLLAACGVAPVAPTATSGPAVPPTTVAKPALPAVNVAATPTTAPAAAPTTAPTAAATSGGKTFVGAWPYEIPPAGHFNTFIPHRIELGIYQDLFESNLAKYYWATNKYTVKLRKGVKWSDGSDFSAKDVKGTLMLARVLRNALFDYVDAIETPDDHTVTLHMNNPSTVVERYTLDQNGTRIRPYAVYGKLAEQAEQLFKSGKDMSSDEGKALLADFQKFHPDKIVSNGPFNVDPSSITNAQ